MNEIEKQILKNQQSIMNVVNYIMVYTQADGSGDLQRQIIEDYEKTKELLNPKSTDEDCCEMGEDAKRDLEE